MWIFTSFGLLMPAERPSKYTPDWDDRRLQVRARKARALDILRAEFMKNTLGETIYTPDKDYEYRAYCTHEAFAIAMMKMTLDVNYTKFKPTTDRYKDHEYHSLLNRIWGVVSNALSDRAHQWGYWKEYGRDEWSWRPDGWNDPKKGQPKTGSGWPDDPGAKSRQASTSADDVRPRSPLRSGGAATSGVTDGASDWRDCRTPQPAGYPGEYDPYGPTGMDGKYALPGGTFGGGVHRNTSATRDKYEPEVWEEVAQTNAGVGCLSVSADALSDEDWRTLDTLLESLPSKDEGALSDPALEGMDIVVRARLEVDDLTRSLGHRMTHSACNHGWGPNAKARCRRKHNNETIKRIEEIERLIEEVEASRRPQQQPALTAG